MTLVPSSLLLLPMPCCPCQVRIDYKESPIPMLEAPSSTAVAGHSSVFLGQLKFSDLRKVLNANGVPAEFYGGILVCCNGAVNIRKVSPTQIQIKGSLCEDYFRIRRVLYGRYEII